MFVFLLAFLEHLSDQSLRREALEVVFLSTSEFVVLCELVALPSKLFLKIDLNMLLFQRFQIFSQR